MLNDHKLDLSTAMMYIHTDYVEAIRLAEVGGIILCPLVSAHFAFAGYLKAYEFIDANRETAIKVIIDVDGTEE